MIYFRITWLGLLLSLICVFSEVKATRDVVFSAIIYRHGDRTPVNPYPTDPYRNESLWPVRFGQLTNIGKLQHYEFGRWLKSRYLHLLGSEYDPTKIRIRSTDVDRTLMSAQANLAGMYPPAGSAVWDRDIPWQPIPIHTVPESLDNVLAGKKKCPRYDKEVHRFKKSDEYKQINEKYRSTYEYLNNYVGETVKSIEIVLSIYNNLFIESLYNFTLPEWTKSVYPDMLRPPSELCFKMDTYTPLMARLKVGPLLKEISGLMEDHLEAEKSSKQLRLMVYSGHDETIGNVLNAMGLFEPHCPSYTSTIFMELVRGDSGLEVQMFYRNFTEIREPLQLSIPNCGVSCPLQKFIEVYDNLISVDWERECADDESERTNQSAASYDLFITLSAAVNILLGSIIVFYVAYRWIADIKVSIESPRKLHSQSTANVYINNKKLLCSEQ